MIVTLSWAQWQSIRLRLSEDLVEAMIEHRRARGKAHDYNLPAIGWRRVLDELTAQAYGPLGGQLSGSESLYRALTRITDAVGLIETHPAFTLGRAAIGIHNDVFPAWVDTHSVDPHRSPYPLIGYDPKMLRPKHQIQGERVYTWWLASDPQEVTEHDVFELAFRLWVDR